jgi:hypothetical protein
MILLVFLFSCVVTYFPSFILGLLLLVILLPCYDFIQRLGHVMSWYSAGRNCLQTLIHLHLYVKLRNSFEWDNIMEICLSEWCKKHLSPQLDV